MSEEASLKEESEKLRLEGNEFFKQQKFLPAIDCYTKALEKCPNVSLYLNRAMAGLKVGYSGEAMEDAEAAQKLEPSNPKAFYRKGVAFVQMGKLKEALGEFKTLVQMVPGDIDAKERLDACQKEYKRIQFLKAIERPDSLAPTTRIQKTPKEVLQNVPASYDGPRFPESGDLTPEYLEQVALSFKKEKLIPQRDVCLILAKAIEVLRAAPNVVNVNTKEGDEEEEIVVCGDTHGQYYDTLNIFEMLGQPAASCSGGKSPVYIFNGDYVDRGSYSVENVVLLLAYKAAYPTRFFMSRGNHESLMLNRMYGFEGEVLAKYNDFVFELLQEAFACLPLAHIINDKVFVTHGGLFSKDDVTISDLQKTVDRFRDIPSEPGNLMCELLWADPMAGNGRAKSKRGTGLDFGPDVTKAFLQRNNLEFVIRSHEVKDPGYEIMHDGKLITLFSAPNYCDQVGNKGAVMVGFKGKSSKYAFKQFSQVPHAGKKPMAYAPRMMGGF